LRQPLLLSEGGGFERLLDRPALRSVMREDATRGRHRLYPPIDTLRLFVEQVLSTDRACQDVVARRLSECIANGQSGSPLGTTRLV
jgi:hypothetical protein